ncbi:MAG: PepSY-associated TM helix domain-containing protein [Pseudomonadota bacterium]
MSGTGRSKRKKYYALHTWLGFHLALLMSLVLLTGTLATISNEIDWLIQADMRIAPADGEVAWKRMETAIRQHAPGHNLLSVSSMGHDWMAYRARLTDEFGKPYFMHVNQWTGEVTGTTPILTVQRFIRDLHRYLFMPSVIGLPLVTSMAFVLAVSLFTGLKTTRQWRKMATRIRTHRGLRVTMGDAHKAGGLWASWFIVLMIITGVWYLAEFGSQLAESPFEPSRPGVNLERFKDHPVILPAQGVADLVASAQRAYPELKVKQVFMPGSAQGAAIVTGRNRDILIRDRANRVFLNPVNGDVIEVQRASDLAWTAYLNELADPLHFGYFAGLTTKLLWFVFGMILTSLSFTGVWLTWKRLGSHQLSRQQLMTLPVLLGMLVASVFYFDRLLGPNLAESEFDAGKVTQEDITAQLFLAQSDNSQFDGRARIRLSVPYGRPNLGSATLQLGHAEPAELKVRGGIGHSTRLDTVLPTLRTSTATDLMLTMKMRNGAQLKMVWSL